MFAASKFKDYLACMLQIGELGEEEIKMLVEALSLGDEQARRCLEEQFLPRVLRWVSPYRGLGLSFECLVETGNRAMMRGLRQLRGNKVIDASDFLERCVVDEVESGLPSRKMAPPSKA
jgi:DNA-directed RNA polymerase sigma subunit (sigma70/sigma32)